MKFSKNSKKDVAVSPEEWQFFDDCPVCRIMKKAAEEGRELSEEELEEAFAKANAQN